MSDGRAETGAVPAGTAPLRAAVRSGVQDPGHQNHRGEGLAPAVLPGREQAGHGPLQPVLPHLAAAGQEELPADDGAAEDPGADVERALHVRGSVQRGGAPHARGHREGLRQVLATLHYRTGSVAAGQRESRERRSHVEAAVSRKCGK